MGNRLSKIYTRTGDAGTTGLGDGSRIAKDSLRVAAMGELDELNSIIGMLICEITDNSLIATLGDVQHDLFDLGGQLSIPGSSVLDAKRSTVLECELDKINDDLPPLTEFILPGGNRPAALCHFARVACRRAERSVVALNDTEPVGESALAYVNRLSDLLFVMARMLARQNGGREVLWRRDRGE